MKGYLKLLPLNLLMVVCRLASGQMIDTSFESHSIQFYGKDSSYLVTTSERFANEINESSDHGLTFGFHPDRKILYQYSAFSIINWAAKNIGVVLDRYADNPYRSDLEIATLGASSIYVSGIGHNVIISSTEQDVLLKTSDTFFDQSKIHLIDGNLNEFKLRLPVRTFFADGSEIVKLELQYISVFKRFEITNTTIDSINLYDTLLPAVAKLEDLDLAKLDGLFDLTHLKNKTNILLEIANVDLTKFDIPYDRFDFIIDTTKHSYEQTTILYQQLLKKLGDAGLSEKYEKYNKQFLEYKYQKTGHRIVNFIAKYWWDYGYDKVRVFYIACGMFVFFFLVNFLFLNFLRDTYWPGKFKDYDEYLEKHVNKDRHKGFFYLYKKAFGVLLYTAFLFWGLKLELKELDLKNRGAIFLIILQYVFGVICLAYLANYVLSK